MLASLRGRRWTTRWRGRLGGTAQSPNSLDRPRTDGTSVENNGIILDVKLNWGWNGLCGLPQQWLIRRHIIMGDICGISKVDLSWMTLEPGWEGLSTLPTRCWVASLKKKWGVANFCPRILLLSSQKNFRLGVKISSQMKTFVFKCQTCERTSLANGKSVEAIGLDLTWGETHVRIFKNFKKTTYEKMK